MTKSDNMAKVRFFFSICLPIASQQKSMAFSLLNSASVHEIVAMVRLPVTYTANLYLKVECKNMPIELNRSAKKC